MDFTFCCHPEFKIYHESFDKVCPDSFDKLRTDFVEGIRTGFVVGKDKKEKGAKATKILEYWIFCIGYWIFRLLVFNPLKNKRNLNFVIQGE